MRDPSRNMKNEKNPSPTEVEASVMTKDDSRLESMRQQWKQMMHSRMESVHVDEMMRDQIRRKLCDRGRTEEAEQCETEQCDWSQNVRCCSATYANAARELFARSFTNDQYSPTQAEHSRWKPRSVERPVKWNFSGVVINEWQPKSSIGELTSDGIW